VTLTTRHIQDIQGLLRARSLVGVPLSRFTSFGIGGPADLVAEPQDVQELASLLVLQTGEFRALFSGRNDVLFHRGIQGVDSDSFHHGLRYRKRLRPLMITVASVPLPMVVTKACAWLDRPRTSGDSGLVRGLLSCGGRGCLHRRFPGTAQTFD
jgi:hypothetical protein